MASSINAITTGSGGVVTTGDNSGDLNIQSGGSTKIAVTSTGAAVTGTLSASGAISSTASANLPNTFGFKNRIINGSMDIDQRNAGASVTVPASTVTYTVDRFFGYATQASKYSVQQNAGSVTPPLGFTNYAGITSLSAYSITSSDEFTYAQNIEGLNVADLAWGTANAATVTLSFWARSSLTGTFGGSLRNSAANRSYPFSYTISAANTWELETITIAGDTSGTWLTTNGIGIRVAFGLGVGSTLSGTAGAWAGANLNSATGATSVVGTSGATFYITGVQLEKGSTATSFDVLDYGNELRMCQRYYETNFQGVAVPTNFYSGTVNTTVGSNTYAGGGVNINQGLGPFEFKVSKRATPTVTTYSYATSTTSMVGNGWAGADLAANTGAVSATSPYSFSIMNSSGGNVTTTSSSVIFNFAAVSEL